MKDKKQVLFLIALVAALVWALPVYAEKASLSEQEMEEVTAAGQPKVVIAEGGTGGAAVVFTENMSIDSAIGNGAQNNLSALTLNHIVGESEVANAINITSSDQNNNTTQENVIQQSWGSVLDWDGAPGADGKDRDASTAGTGEICVFGPCTVGQKGGNGKDATRLSSFGDVIIHATQGGAGTVGVDVDELNSYQLTLGNGALGNPAPNAQQGLSALVLNNVVGMNQVANGLNITAGSVDGGTVGAPQSGGPSSASQLNVVDQFRGSPLATPTTVVGGVVTLGTIQADRN